MPHRMWQHCCASPGSLSGSPTCGTCGAPGTFEGWHLSIWESAARYHYVYELNPFGSHRRLADTLLGAMRDRCVHCYGRGIQTIDQEGWRDCPWCEGTGGVWSRPVVEVDAVRNMILRSWPNAALPWVGNRRRRAGASHQPAATHQGPTSRTAASPGTPGGRMAVSRARRAVRRPPGVSPDGITYGAVRSAFAQAQQALGAEWQLYGRGHCEGVTLKAHYSRHARLGAAESVRRFAPSGSMARVYVFPAELVRRAAEKLKVDASVLISKRW